MRDQEQQSLAFWDEQAQRETKSGKPGFLVADHRFAAYRDRVEKALFYRRVESLVGPTTRVLELGCGSGRWTVDLASRYAHVTATDISAKMLEHARQAVASAGLHNVRLLQGSFDRLALPAERFNLIFFGACLHYMSEEAIQAGLARLSGVLASDALVASKDTVSVLGRTFHRAERYRDSPDPAIYRTPETYAELFAAHGWQLMQSWPAYVTPLSWRLRALLPDGLLTRFMTWESRHAEFALKHARLLDQPKDKQHRFFLYRRA